MKNLNYFLVVCCLLLSVHLLAHEGGHYHHGDGQVLATWTLKSGKIIKGNFSFARNNEIFVEQEEGIMQSILIENLIPQDQLIANAKINRLDNINLYNGNTFETNPIKDVVNRFKYLPLLTFLLILLVFHIFNKPLLQNILYQSKMGMGTASIILFFVLFIACSKSTSSTTTTSTTTEIVIPKTNALFVDSAFLAFKPALTTSWDNSYFYISSTGIPNHNMMIGITNWQQQVPITQPYTGTNSWSIPLQPAFAAIPLSTKTNLMKGAVAVAVNGIPIFNALNNRGEDSYKIGELDNWGGHCGRGDDYHYHAAPLHLSTINGLKPIAFAVDGFPVYGSKEPDGTNMIALDTCHGHTGSNGIYHYHGTADYPYVIGALKGKVTLDPTTTAPENQVIPQAFTKPVRPATNPLNGAVITDFVAVGTNGYLLTYKIGTKNGYVRYSWDVSNKYTFILTDTSGTAVTTSYQR